MGLECKKDTVGEGSMWGGGKMEMIPGGEEDPSMLLTHALMYRDTIQKPTKYCFLKGGIKKES
jgi:hypothetical protein